MQKKKPEKEEELAEQQKIKMGHVFQTYGISTRGDYSHAEMVKF